MVKRGLDGDGCSEMCAVRGGRNVDILRLSCTAITSPDLCMARGLGLINGASVCDTTEGQKIVQDKGGDPEATAVAVDGNFNTESRRLCKNACSVGATKQRQHAWQM